MQHGAVEVAAQYLPLQVEKVVGVRVNGGRRSRAVRGTVVVGTGIVFVQHTADCFIRCGVCQGATAVCLRIKRPRCLS